MLVAADDSRVVRTQCDQPARLFSRVSVQYRTWYHNHGGITRARGIHTMLQASGRAGTAAKVLLPRRVLSYNPSLVGYTKMVRFFFFLQRRVSTSSQRMFGIWLSRAWRETPFVSSRVMQPACN
jgi:hypothetical protein